MRINVIRWEPATTHLILKAFSLLYVNSCETKKQPEQNKQYSRAPLPPRKVTLTGRERRKYCSLVLNDRQGFPLGDFELKKEQKAALN